jgi:hypothetical protein
VFTNPIVASPGNYSLSGDEYNRREILGNFVFSRRRRQAGSVCRSSPFAGPLRPREGMKMRAFSKLLIVLASAAPIAACASSDRSAAGIQDGAASSTLNDAAQGGAFRRLLRRNLVVWVIEPHDHLARLDGRMQ